MSILNGNLVLATAMTLVLTGCGGTVEPVPVDSETSSTIQESATDTASQAVDSTTTAVGDATDTATQAADNAAGEAGDALNQASDSAAAALDSSKDAIADAADSAGWTDLQGNWQDSIGSIKDRWADLSEEELLSVDGDRDALVTLVQEKYGLDRDTAESQVSDWASTL
ncbi:hypothetical protein [Granulosicoccus antarcticus]|uniref:CsbD-like domain-containing protein n=1 Tax=Granulosicoccus antarcticus IMCC3135 TaxID=1192854 RepID=A0A2Z2NI93_9GAMM|nr:hypothetical protein [Granulosicoccus antarcticus]ASJ70859.1 hypothetical protein IMCC3135_03730 [Granulosicoccus antarcticus IMCC3135]